MWIFACFMISKWICLGYGLLFRYKGATLCPGETWGGIFWHFIDQKINQLISDESITKIIVSCSPKMFYHQKQWQHNNLGYQTMEQYHEGQRGDGWARGSQLCHRRPFTLSSRRAAERTKTAQRQTKRGRGQILQFLHNLDYVNYSWTSENTTGQSQRKEQETCSTMLIQPHLQHEYLPGAASFLYQNLTTFLNGLIV